MWCDIRVTWTSPMWVFGFVLTIRRSRWAFTLSLNSQYVLPERSEPVEISTALDGASVRYTDWGAMGDLPIRKDFRHGSRSAFHFDHRFFTGLIVQYVNSLMEKDEKMEIE